MNTDKFKMEVTLDISEIKISDGGVEVRAFILPLELYAHVKPEVLIRFPLRGECSKLLCETLKNDAMLTLIKSQK